MNPNDVHQRNAGEVEALPDGLRDMLLAGTGRAKRDGDDLPGLPKEKQHKTGTDAPRSISRGHLTNRQKQVLCQLAAAAYAVQQKHGLIDEGVKLEAWRHAEQLEAVGIGSLRDCRQAHYLHLRGHFEALASGEPSRAFAGMTAAIDDPDRQTIRAILKTELARFADLDDDQGRRMGEHRAEAYAMTIAKRRGYVGSDQVGAVCDHWDTNKLWTLIYTLRNRIAAKRGVGETRERNKSQRRGTRA